MDLKNKVPGLFAFNRMVIARKGNVPCNVIRLIGSDDDIKAVVNYETTLFFDEGLTINDAVIIDKSNTNVPQVYLFEDESNVAIDSNNIYFVKNIVTNIRANTFDVTGLGGPDAIKKFVTKLGFDNVDEIDAWIRSKGGRTEQFDIMFRQGHTYDLINTILEYHFTRHSDNVCHTDDALWAIISDEINLKKDDISPINVERTKEMKAPSGSTFANRLSKSHDEIKNNEKISDKPVEPKNETKEATKDESVKNESKNVTKASNNEVRHGGAASKLSNFSKQRDNVSKQKKAEAKEAEDTGFVPKPVEKKEKKVGTTKEIITIAEDEKNHKLLDEMTKIYQETMDFIDETCNTQFRIIRNKMEEALKNKKFRQQYCPMYLDITDDISTELYKRLYNLDLTTSKFYKELTSQVVEMGCAFCGKSWKEDITFMEPGPHFIQCPHCTNERPYEKEPITE